MSCGEIINIPHNFLTKTAVLQVNENKYLRCDLMEKSFEPHKVWNGYGIIQNETPRIFHNCLRCNPYGCAISQQLGLFMVRRHRICDVAAFT